MTPEEQEQAKQRMAASLAKIGAAPHEDPPAPPPPPPPPAQDLGDYFGV